MLKSAAVISSFTGFATAFQTRIYGTYPGYKVGKGKVGIQIEIFFDYLCGGCQSENPVIEELLQHQWLDGTVEDQITVLYTPFPLPYHTHSYQVNQLVPYFMDLCVADSTKCFNDEYRDFSFSQLDNILSMTDTSRDAFITYWSQQVAKELGLEASDIEASYTSSTYNTDISLRAMWDYGVGKGVHGTPTGFANGALIDDLPDTVPGWMKLLDEIYKSQYKAHLSFIQD